MRVVSGTHRGRRLVCPPGQATRPTADRIKEALFSILGGRLGPLRVLDLFAGSGALGIEALSRGAGWALFIEQAPAALSAIQRNLTSLELTGRSRVVAWDIRRSLACLAGEAPFDLVFMDPPYASGAVAPTLALLADGCLAPRARIVIEHARGEAIDLPGAEWRLNDQRRYGKTLVSFVDCML